MRRYCSLIFCIEFKRLVRFPENDNFLGYEASLRRFRKRHDSKLLNEAVLEFLQLKYRFDLNSLAALERHYYDDFNYSVQFRDYSTTQRAQPEVLARARGG